MDNWGFPGSLDDVGPDELRQRLLSLQAIIARAPVPIAIAHDPDCRVVTCNRALSALLGVPADSNISLTPPPGAAPLYRIQQDGRDLPPSELPMQYAIAHHTSVSNEIEIVRADGTVVYVQNDVEPLYDLHGQFYGCVSVCVDHTEQRMAAFALREADRRKDEFLATLSHELRNPLAPIRTALEVMRLAKADPDLVDRAHATIERQVAHMVRITDDLLDVARITQNKVQLRRERLDLRGVLHGAIEAVRPFIDVQRHSLSVDVAPDPIWIDADPTRLAQVFSNLLNNAAKYTDPGGEIRVRATASGAQGVVSVIDTGVGIPPAMLPSIFDMFTQLPADRDRTHGGLGIGLTLARRLVEMHDGQIEALSEGPGRGSRFTVHLPLAAVRAQERAPGAARAPAGLRCRVLIADDNVDAGAMLQLMLEIKGHDVRVATDGLEAVAIAESFEPQIAFLDIGMPRLDGYETARRMRTLLGRKVLLVALTGWGQDEDKRRSSEAGFDHHLTKPPEPDVLEQLVAGRLVSTRT
jgi:signal transduction histidine kinase